MYPWDVLVVGLDRIRSKLADTSSTQTGTVRWTVFAAFVIVVSIFAIGPVAGAQPASCTPITGPTTITSPGCYVVASDAIDSTAPVYIDVQSSDVIIDGNGHRLDGVDAAYSVGVRVGHNVPVTNVTVRNLTVADWDTGIHAEYVDAVRLIDVAAESNAVAGVYVYEGTNVTVERGAFHNNTGGLSASAVVNVTVSDSEAVRNTWGFHFDGDGLLVQGNDAVENDIGYEISDSTGYASVTLRENNASANRVGFVVSWLSGAEGTFVFADNAAVANTQGGMVFEGVSVATIERPVANLNGGSGIQLSGTNDVVVRDPTVAGNDGDGIRVGGGSFSTVGENNRIEAGTIWGNTGSGIGIDHYTNATTIVDTYIEGNDHGIVTESGSENVSVTNTTVVGNTNAGILSRGPHTDVVASTIENNEVGIYLYRTEWPTLAGNVVANNSNVGIQLDEATDATLDDNLVTGNEIGVHASGGYGLSLDRTVVRDSDRTGIMLLYGYDTTLNRTTTTENGWGGLHLESPGAQLRSTNASGNAGSGVFVDARSGVTLMDTVARANADHGVHVVETDNVTVHGGSVVGNGDTTDEYGLLFERAPDAHIGALSIRDHGRAVFLDGSPNATLAELVLSDAELGIRIMGGPAVLRDSHLTDISAFGAYVVGEVVVRNITATGPSTASAGIRIDGGSATDATLRANTVSGFGSGIHVTNSYSVTVADNVVEDGVESGIFVQRPATAHIEGNAVRNVDYAGIDLRGVIQDATVIGNTLTANGASGLIVDRAENVTVTANRVADNGASGITIVESSTSTLAGNHASNNTESGIAVEDSHDAVVVTENTLTANGDAGLFLGTYSSTYDSLIESASVTNNTVTANGAFGVVSFADGLEIANNAIRANGDTGVIGLLPGDSRVRKNTITGHSRAGIDLDGGFSGGTNAPAVVIDNVVTGNALGIKLSNTGYLIVGENDVTNNTNGLFLAYVYGGTVDGVDVSDSADTALELRYLHEGTVANVTAHESGRYALLADRHHPGSMIRDLELGNSTAPTTVSLVDFENVALVDVSSPPADPAGYRNLGHHVRVENTSEGRYFPPGTSAPQLHVRLGVAYAPADLDGADPGSLEVWRHNGTWASLPTTVDASASYVYANVTQTSITAPMAPLAPTVAFTTAPTDPTEGTPIAFDASPSTAPGGTITSYEWTFGDGTTITTADPVVKHTYIDNGTYTVSLTVTDDDGDTNTTSATVVVANAPPAVETITFSDPVAEGSTVSVNGTIVDPGIDDVHTVHVNWGDGTAGTATVTQTTEGAEFATTHVYADNDTYTVTLTVADDDGATTTAIRSATVTNAVPTVSMRPPDDAFTGQPVSVNATFTDPGTNDTHTATIDWGDGTIGSVFVTQGSGSKSLTASHTYADGGSYTVTLTVTDDDGGWTTTTDSITVTYVVEIDVKPGNSDETNPINPKGDGVVPVAIYTTSMFDATTVDVSSLRFGAESTLIAGDGAIPAHNGHLEDIDQDGDLDLVVHFDGETGLEAGDGIAAVAGSTIHDVPIYGTDAIRVTGSNGAGNTDAGGNGNDSMN